MIYYIDTKEHDFIRKETIQKENILLSLIKKVTFQKEKIFPSLFRDLSFYTIDGSFVTFCKNLSAEENGVHLKEDDVLLINGDMIYGENSKPSDFNGILLLKWLRIYKRLTNRIVVFGMVPLQYIIARHPEHIILMAEGTTYIQAPFFENELRNAIDSVKVIEKDKLFEIYRPFVKADFNIEQIAHSFANEFGLYLMQLVHQHITKTKINIDISQFTVFDFRKANFLYSPRINIDNKKEIDKISGQLKKEVDRRHSQILYIDDQANLGWGKLLCDMIFGSETHENFKVISNPNELNIDNIKDEIDKQKPNCILLDLRLKGDDENGLPIKEISGYILLQEIKTDFPVLPVIIISATNKADNLSALLKAGAEGLWTKPRVESALNSSYLSDSYINLLQIIHDSITKFKTQLGKVMARLDFSKNIVWSVNTNNDDYLSKSIFIFDTHYFICNDQHEDPDYRNYETRIRYFLSLVNTIKSLGLRKRIIISHDVLSELFVQFIREFPESKDVSEEGKVSKRVSSKYAFDLISSLINSESEVIYYNFFQEYSLKSTDITYEISEMASERKYYLYKNKSDFINFFTTYEKAEDEKYKLEHRDKKNTLHADDTLKLWLDYYSKRYDKDIKNIFFISSDFSSNNNAVSYLRHGWRNIEIDPKKTLYQRNDYSRLIKTEISLTINGNPPITRKIFVYPYNDFIEIFKKKTINKIDGIDLIIYQ